MHSSIKIMMEFWSGKIKSIAFMRNKWKSLLAKIFIAGMCLFSSCNYLDVVPDNVATIEYAFRLRSQAEKYLFTCYSYLPSSADYTRSPALLTGDEIWFYYPYNAAKAAPPGIWEIARGNQNIIDPYLNYWDGSRGGIPLFEGIRDCNTFLDNIDKVPDINDDERRRWISEIKFLKAYYHWYLLRMYGPIPIIDENIAISAEVEDVKVERQTIDSCFHYIVTLIDESVSSLPNEIQNRVSEMGRITLPIALSIKARILMSYASPLFNGNTSYSNFMNNDGEAFFNQVADPERWKIAADACKSAIDACHAAGYQLYYFNPAVNTYNIGRELQTQMDIRNSICEKWNSEVIWGATNGLANLIQAHAQATINPSVSVMGSINDGYHADYAPTLKIAELFYTKNGLPINEDKTWNYNDRYGLDTATTEDRFYIKPGYISSSLNFDREPRFYADLGFDGGFWYGQGRYDEEDMWHVEGKLGQYSGRIRDDQYSITGYYAKKLVNFLNEIQVDGVYQIQKYPWPIMRLADLYLYYSEALNEMEGPTGEAQFWINMVRSRAGIPTIKEAWDTHAIQSSAYKSKDGFRKIIHRERLIEMAFEGSRYWDLRRWKEAESTLNQPIRGWDISQRDAEYYYQPTLLFDQSFKLKDYFWPIREDDLTVNKKLIQNPGW